MMIQISTQTLSTRSKADMPKGGHATIGLSYLVLELDLEVL